MKEKLNNYVIKVITTKTIYTLIVFLMIIVFSLSGGFLIGALSKNHIETVIKLLPPIGIILSAALASLSVLRSIENTNNIENRKKEESETKILKRLKFYLYQTYSICMQFDKLIENEKFETVNELKNYIKYEKLIEAIEKDKELIGFLDDENLYLFQINLSALSIINMSNIKTINEFEEYKKNIVSLNEELIKVTKNISEKYNLKME